MLRPKKRIAFVASLPIIAIGALLAAAERPDAPGPGSSSKELVDAARYAYEIKAERYRARLAPLEDVYVWSRRWMTAEWDLRLQAGDGPKSVKAHLERMAELEKLVRAMRAEGLDSEDAVAAATYYRTEAELMLARAGE